MAAKTEKIGVVISDKMQKSVVVAVERQVRHGMYGKAQRRTSTFLAYRCCRHYPGGHQGHKLLPYSSRRNAKSRFNLFDAERSLLL